MFKAKPIPPWDIIEKDVIDEIIFRTEKQRDRLILELMASGGMSFGKRLTHIRIYKVHWKPVRSVIRYRFSKQIFP